MLSKQTHTVVTGFTDREGRHWVFVRDNPRKLAADEAYPEGTAVHIVAGRAVKR